MAQWSRPVEIPNQSSKTTAALAVIRSLLHMVHLGASSDNLWHSYWIPATQEWSENLPLFRQSCGRVALGQDGLLVYQATQTNPDGARPLAYSVFDGGWPNSKLLPDIPVASDVPAVALTSDAPAVALTSENTWAVVRQVPHQGYLLAGASYGLRLGRPSTVDLIETSVLDELSAKVPALALDRQSRLHMVYLNKGSKELWHSFGNSVKPIPNQSSRDVPAMAFHNNALHMVHIGADSDKIWHSWFDFDRGKWSDNVPIDNHLSNKPPALASYDGVLHMVHKGHRSNRIWHSMYK
ncbi:MAG TPA: hypothetical protein VF521_03030 [Pyrinomonadaceae bacterium]|jgi:hypothetical protein